MNDEQKFVGRKVQLAELRKLFGSKSPQFIAVYGRRRVGKTFLIREAARNKFTFYFTAAYDVSKSEQLTNFALALKRYSGSDTLEKFDSWMMAFGKLRDYLDSLSKKANKIIFIDELPWADTPKSGFMAAFENFWNVYCAFRKDIKLVVCGSATSWIINSLINNKGGLHGRLTHTFVLEPFSLWEAQQYFKDYGYSFNEKQVAEIYMIMGGIPYYFSLLEKGESVAKNIDRLFFSENAILRNEFEKLYASLYRNPSLHIEVIKVLATKNYGLTRQEIISRLKITGNGTFSTVLKELTECGFIRCFQPFETKTAGATGKVRRRSVFRLIDLYSLFYLRFVRENDYHDSDFWSSNYRDPKLNVWRGLAFETLCLWHIAQIKESLGISGMSTKVCAWTGTNEAGEKAQIDLIIDRKDDTLNICEIKYFADKFTITKNYAEEVERKISVFLTATGTKKTPVVTFITTNGVTPNQYSDLAQKQIVLSQLFKY